MGLAGWPTEIRLLLGGIVVDFMVSAFLRDIIAADGVIGIIDGLSLRSIIGGRGRGLGLLSRRRFGI